MKHSQIHIHCSSSDNPAHDNIETIRTWHLARGWNDIGYHFVILRDGTMKKGRPLSMTPASIRGHNKNALAICLTGKHDFTFLQFKACAHLCSGFLSLNHLTVDDIYPHYHFTPHKTCPNFPIEIIRLLV